MHTYGGGAWPGSLMLTLAFDGAAAVVTSSYHICHPDLVHPRCAVPAQLSCRGLHIEVNKNINNTAPTLQAQSSRRYRPATSSRCSPATAQRPGRCWAASCCQSLAQRPCLQIWVRSGCHLVLVGMGTINTSYGRRRAKEKPAPPVLLPAGNFNLPAVSHASLVLVILSSTIRSSNHPQ